jgi:hypothetical protein
MGILYGHQSATAHREQLAEECRAARALVVLVIVGLVHFVNLQQRVSYN